MDYKIKPGDWLSKIALKHGFNDGGAAIWDVNPELHEKSGNNPDVLQPGWIITIPEKKPTRYTRSTGNEYSLVRSSLAENIYIKLIDATNNPVSGWSYSLRADGKELASGESSSEGIIEVRNIPEDISKAELELHEEHLFHKLKLKPEKIDVEIGGLDPIYGDAQPAIEAVQKILTNLGYHEGEIDGKFGPITRAAIRAFQKRYGIQPAHGLADKKTCQYLNYFIGVRTKEADELENEARVKWDSPLSIGTQASSWPEYVTGLSEYLEPIASDQITCSKLGSFHYFPHKAFLAPTSSPPPQDDTNTIKMPSRKFIFLDVGQWLGEKEDDKKKRNFGLIYGRHVYLCRYLAGGGAELDIEPPKDESRLDYKFFSKFSLLSKKDSPPKGQVLVDQWACADWAPDSDFDWNKLFIILPDTHFMTKETSDIWLGKIGEPCKYKFEAEKDLYNFAAILIKMEELKGNIQIIQMGDAYDLWVHRPCLFKNNDDRKIELIDPKPNSSQICEWIWDIQFSGPGGLSRKIPGPLGNDQVHNPGEQALQLLRNTYKANMIYIYGNHDNYLILSDVCKEAVIPERLRWYAPKGIFMEHAHRMEARFLLEELKKLPVPDKARKLVPGHNYDGSISGHQLTNECFDELNKGTLSPKSYAKSVAGKLLEKAKSSWYDWPEYRGEQAQVWLGRQNKGDPKLKPPHVFVIAHTHKARLNYVEINPSIKSLWELTKRNL
jgi:hypothetical protein